MKIQGLALAIIVSVICLSCSVPRTNVLGDMTAGQTINQNGKFLIMSCDDAQERGEEVTKGSANALTSALRDAMMKHSMKLSITQAKDLSEAYKEAQQNSFDYLLRPAFTNWEDNATAWSGNGDKVGISVEIYDVTAHTLVGASSYSRTATGFTLASGSPMRFLPESANKALSKMFHWQ